MPRALIIVDVQNDFCEGGSLEVANGSQVIPVFNALRTQHKWDAIILTQDWHPADHISFASNHQVQVFSVKKLDDGFDQVMWPNHCVQNSNGAEFHKDLLRSKECVQDIFLFCFCSDIIVQKGKNKLVDSYSGFFDNNKKQQTEMDAILKQHNITEVYVGGLAYDFCVQFTARDAAALGYKTYFVEDASLGISAEGIQKAKQAMQQEGITIVNSSQI